MIKYEWRTHLDPEESAELADLLDRASSFDAEAEHNSIDFAAVDREMAASSESVRHLVIWMLPHAVAMDRPDDPARIAGLIRVELDPDDAGKGDVTAVVDPAYRSIGIITSLLEQVGVDTDEDAGWLGTGAHTLRAWARGNHPAAGRLSRRFLIPPNRRVWKLIRPFPSARRRESDLKIPISGSLTSARENGRIVLDLRPAHSDEFGSYATIDEILPTTNSDAHVRRELLDTAAATAAEHGFDAVAIFVDAEDRALVNACRLSGFQHDRTDVCYQIGGPS